MRCSDPADSRLSSSRNCQVYRRARDLCVENIRIEVCPVGPHNCAEVGVESDLGKLFFVAERRKDSLRLDHASKIQIALDSIFEAKVDSVLSKRSNFDNIFQHPLPQRFDPDQRSFTTVSHVDLWRRVVIVEHRDDDPEKPGDLRQPLHLSALCRRGFYQAGPPHR